MSIFLLFLYQVNIYLGKFNHYWGKIIKRNSGISLGLGLGGDGIPWSQCMDEHLCTEHLGGGNTILGCNIIQVTFNNYLVSTCFCSN